MLPLTLLRTAQGHPILVELKSGETYNGVLVNVDHWLNLNLTKVTCTSRDGDKFWKLTSIYIKGSTVKYMNIPENVLEMTPDELPVERPNEKKRDGNRGGRGGRGGNSNGGRGGRGGSFDKDNKSAGSERGGHHRGGRGHSEGSRGGRGSSGGRGGRGGRGGGPEYKPRGVSSK